MWSACFGNLFEHYDAALFGFLSSFLASFIFPEKEPVTALILVYAMIPLGMLARPLGALVFGYIGDVYGRGLALFLTLAGMALVSGTIALSPMLVKIGILTPIIFGVGRALQNFFAAGETIGGAIYLLENTQEKRHDLLSSLYNATTIGGILLASSGVAFLSHYGIIHSNWHYLYTAGCITALFGCVVRKPIKINSQPALSKTSQNVFAHLKVFWTYKTPLLWIAISSGFSYANYSIALILMNGFVPLVSPTTTTQMMQLNTFLLVVDFCTLPIFGWLASKISREKLMLFASISALIGSIPLFMMLQGASIFGIITIRVCLVLIGVAFAAPFHAWAQQLIPPVHRYSVISFGYALGSQLLGGPTAAISLWLFKKTHVVSSVSWYWLGLAFATSGVMASAYVLRKRESTVS